MTKFLVLFASTLFCCNVFTGYSQKPAASSSKIDRSYVLEATMLGYIAKDGTRNPVLKARKDERVLGQGCAVGAVRDRAVLHRWPAPARARLLRDHQPPGQLLQTAGAGVRGASERRVVDAEPLTHAAYSGPARDRDPYRAADAGPRRESVPRARGPTRRRIARHRDEGGFARAREHQHLGDVAS